MCILVGMGFDGLIGFWGYGYELCRKLVGLGMGGFQSYRW